MFKKPINDNDINNLPTLSEEEKKLFLRRKISTFIGLAFLIIAIISFLASLIVFGVVIKLPDVRNLSSQRDQSTIIYDINGSPIANLHGDEDREVIALNKISPWLQRAVISSEDYRFYSHSGIDLKGTIRALFVNLINNGEAVQGGSTLTQQLVKNTYLIPEKSFKRKLLEAIFAIRVERYFSKNEILEMYLNQIYWGNHCFGAQKAAKRYFGRDAKDLNLAQSAFLAGLLTAPEGYSPYKNYKGAKMRQKIVLEKMYKYGYITKGQRDNTFSQELKLYSNRQKYSKYAYFVQYVIKELKGIYGDDIVKKGGFRVYTTLDPVAQTIAEKVMTEGIKKFPASSGAQQGALVSIKVENGYIQAMVGGLNFAQSNFNRATQSRRAAGSSFKPIVYLTGFRKKVITPDSPIVDAPIAFNTGWNIWRPHNWDGKFMGKMDVRKALTLSRNTPTVRVALKVGVDEIIKTARLAGLKGHIDKNFSIALGSLGISPLEMATAYSTFAREGVYIEPTSIVKIEDSDGYLIELNKPSPVRVFDKDSVRALDSILIDVVEKGTGKRAILSDRKVAGKTGTSDEVRDLWFTGFTPDTVTSIWLGNDRNTPIKGLFSSSCVQLWHDFSAEYYMKEAISPHYFNLEYKIEKVRIKEIKPEKIVIKVKHKIKKVKTPKKANEKKLAPVKEPQKEDDFYRMQDRIDKVEVAEPLAEDNSALMLRKKRIIVEPIQ